MTSAPSPQPDPPPLCFAVLDEEDLAVMSAHLQDAMVSLENVAYLTASARFAAVASRIDWPSLAAGQQARREAGFHFDRVQRVRRIGFDQTAPGPLQLLAVSFTATDGPTGEVLFTFAGGQAIKLDVECLEAEMRDLGASRPVDDCRRHQLDEVAAAR